MRDYSFNIFSLLDIDKVNVIDKGKRLPLAQLLNNTKHHILYRFKKKRRYVMRVYRHKERLNLCVSVVDY